jgi:hypothetical protein
MEVEESQFTQQLTQRSAAAAAETAYDKLSSDEKKRLVIYFIICILNVRLRSAIAYV